MGHGRMRLMVGFLVLKEPCVDIVRDIRECTPLMITAKLMGDHDKGDGGSMNQPFEVNKVEVKMAVTSVILRSSVRRLSMVMWPRCNKDSKKAEA